MYQWLKHFDFSSYRTEIDNFVNILVDPATLSIPDDAVFVSYRQSEQLRLISADTLLKMSKEMDESRKFIEKAPVDESGIALVVNHNKADKPYEKELKDILQFCVQQGMNRAEIRMISNVLNFGAIQAMTAAKSKPELYPGIIHDVKAMVKEDKAHLMDQYLKILEAQDKPSGFQLLPQYLEELITQQMVELESHRKKLRDEEGDDLTPEEIICPYTRQVINVTDSLPTKLNASEFIMLVVALAKLAKVDNSDLEDFISQQDSEYVNKCFELLQNYAQHNEESVFTIEQREKLNQFGMDKVIQLWKSEEINKSSETETKKEGKSIPLEKSVESLISSEHPSTNTPESSPRQTFGFFGLVGTGPNNEEKSKGYTP